MRVVRAVDILANGVSRHGAHCSCRYCGPDVAQPAEIHTIEIPLADAPQVIAESVLSVLTQHRFAIRTFAGDPVDLTKLLREIGRNTAQALTSLDVNADDGGAL